MVGYGHQRWTSFDDGNNSSMVPLFQYRMKRLSMYLFFGQATPWWVTLLLIVFAICICAAVCLIMAALYFFFYLNL